MSERIPTECSGPECDRPVKAKGLCHSHNAQRLRGIQLHVIGQRGPRRPAEDRFFEKVEQVGDCWSWTGRRDGGGYGMFYVAGRSEAKAHRWAYEFMVGEIPEGLQLDHLCHDPADCQSGDSCPHRACVNPWHLEPVTPAVNTRRSGARQALAAYMAAITHCKHGHEFTPENTYMHRGKRHCRTCRAATVKGWHAHASTDA